MCPCACALPMYKVHASLRVCWGVCDTDTAEPCFLAIAHLSSTIGDLVTPDPNVQARR